MNYHIVWILATLGACIAAPRNPSFTSANLNDSFSRFSDNLVKTIAMRWPSSNFIVSPLTLAETLMIVYYGSGGRTLKELKAVLHLPDPVPEVARENLKLIKELNQAPHVQLKHINNLYVDNEFPLNQTMTNWVGTDFSSTLENVNLENGVRFTNYINDFVKNRTNCTIQNLVDASHMDPIPKMVAVNALYFQSEWEGFDQIPSQTFYLQTGAVVDTIMISSTKKYKYHDGTNFVIASIPFKNDDFAMILMMKKDPSSDFVLPSILEGLKLTSNHGETVNVVLPRFTLETEHDFRSVLQDMNVKTVFTLSVNLSKFLHHAPNNDEIFDLYMSKYFNKFYIKVNSGGIGVPPSTEAPLPVDKCATHQFVFDRPFYAYVTYRSIPLLGMRVCDPMY